MRDKLKSLIDTFFCSVDIDKFYAENQKEKLADWLREYGVTVPPCEIGEEIWFVDRNERGEETMTKYERIRNMTIEEMAEFIINLLTAHLNNYSCDIGNGRVNLTETERKELINQWIEHLESEVEEK